MSTSCLAEPAVVAVTADPDLVALEFEAIVAANFPPSAARRLRLPPTVRCATATRVAPPGGRTIPAPAGIRGVRKFGRRPGARERSPPARTRTASTDP